MSYLRIKTSNHPYADKKGMYPVHRLIAESYLGRHLKPYEIVHHINEKIRDNRIENLIVFEDTTSHMIWHKRLSRRYVIKNMAGRRKIYDTLDSRNCHPGVVLYGPACKKIKEKRLKNFAERTKEALGLINA